MANIDTSTIDGFDAMSAEDKVTALLGYSIPDPVDLSGYVKKDVLDAKTSELATITKQLRSKTNEADDATAKLTTATTELNALKHTAYLAQKGFTGEEAEFLAFKAEKMVDEKTTFEQAVDALTKDRKAKFDWSAGVGGGSNKETPNKAMNDLIRGAFK